MAHRNKKALHLRKGLGFGLLTLGTGLTMILFAGATASLAVSVAGIPAACLTGIATAGAAEITYLFYTRASHHLYHAAKNRHQFLHQPTQDRQIDKIKAKTITPFKLPISPVYEVSCVEPDSFDEADSMDSLSSKRFNTMQK